MLQAGGQGEEVGLAARHQARHPEAERPVHQRVHVSVWRER